MKVSNNFPRPAANLTWLTLFIIIFSVLRLNAQSVYEPVGNDIYNYLERLSVKGIIKYHDEIKPLLRKDIASLLIQADIKKNKLTKLEYENLVFYEKEFADAIDMIKRDKNFKLPRLEYLTKGETGRFRFFNYRDSSFTFYADPILGLEYRNLYGGHSTHRWNGAKLSGYYNPEFGFELDYTDNEENGSNFDSTKNFSPGRGIVLTKKGKESVQYDEVNAQINYSWKNGALSAGKYYLNWGSGVGGKLILSDKAPSFPLIRFDFSPVSWLRFTYIHGWLHSGILDSNTYRYTPVPGRQSYLQIEKFIAAHMLSFDIKDNLTFSIGESVIYSERLQPLYLIPVMFFRAADHYLQKKGSNTGSNAQMFADIYYKNYDIRTKFYSTLFIDELSLENIFKGGNLSAIAFTVGAEVVDPVIHNSSFVLEYSRLNPFVYMNSNNAQLYTSYDYPLGHWIGSNGDQVYLAYKQGITRGLQTKLSLSYVRKGQKELPIQQYQSPYPPILYGSKKKSMDIKFELSYEVIHSLFAKVFYEFSDMSDAAIGRTPDFMLGRHNNFGISVGYGL